MSAPHIPDEAARTAMARFYAARLNNPDVVPYIGPEDTLRRFLGGAVITPREFVTDQSPFTVEAMLPVQMRRLKFMMEQR